MLPRPARSRFPSICKHNVFRKDILVIYLVYNKLTKDANGYWIDRGFQMMPRCRQCSALAARRLARLWGGRVGLGTRTPFH